MNATAIRKFETEAEWLNARACDVSSTEAAALFGLSPYQTPFELFHRKRDATLVEFEDNERMKWGRRLQAPIATGIAEDNGWSILQDGDLCYARHINVAGMGTSFDYIVDAPTFDGPGILEIKNVDGLAFRGSWVDAGEDSEAPAHIELQLQHQLEVLNLSWGCIAALIGGNRPVTIIRERDREVGARIVEKVRDLWRRVKENDPPRPDFTADAEFISRLYGYAEPGKVLDLAATPNERIAALVAEYTEASKTAKYYEDSKDAARAELLTIVGSHERITAPGFTITASMVAPTRVEYDRKGYRGFRVTMKKEKAK